MSVEMILTTDQGRLGKILWLGERAEAELPWSMVGITAPLDMIV